jgi:hypothetical protein
MEVKKDAYFQNGTRFLTSPTYPIRREERPHLIGFDVPSLCSRKPSREFQGIGIEEENDVEV